MKVLEAQSAILTNYEVAQFIDDQRCRYASEVTLTTGKQRRAPNNMESLVEEVNSYLRAFPSPLHETDPGCPKAYAPDQYEDQAVHDITARLKPYGLTKAEVFMIINLRPENRPILSVIIEEIESRLTNEQQGEILAIIKNILGSFPPELREHYGAGGNQQREGQEQEA